MFKNYIKIAIRNLNRNKVYSLINIGGLTVGLACSLLIFLYIQDEMSFDKIHENYQNIHRLGSRYEINENFETNLDFPAGLAPILREETEGIKNAVRYDRKGKAIVVSGTEKMYEENLSYTEPAFFEMFNFDLASGNKKTALINPLSIVISQELADKYFADTNPIGQTFSVDEKDFQVTGVLAPVPHNTHFTFNMLASFATLNGENDEWAVFPNYTTFVEVEEGTSLEELHNTILDVLKVKGGEYVDSYTKILSDPLADIYLKVDYWAYDELRGNIEYVRIFLIIGILILAIACINYMNLATARASLRSMEIGVRKATGALRSQLVHQFLSESVLLACASGVLAIGLIELLLPSFNQITGKALTLNFIANPESLLIIFGVAVGAGLLAGAYPALFLSGFHPVSVLKGQFKSGRAAIYLRKGLVVTQFVITIGLIVCTIVINKQLNFLNDKGLGLDTESLISIPAENDIDTKYQAFKSELLKNPNVVGVTTAQILLGGISFETFPGDDQPGNKPSGNTLQILRTDYDFVSTLGLNLIAGRDFDPELSQDATNSILLNETSIEEFGWATADESLGQEIVIGSHTYTVIGMVEDFHALSPAYSILPVAIRITDTAAEQVLVRLRTGDLQNSVESLKSAWTKFEPFLPFEVNFMDDELYALYVSERNLSILFNAFAFLTIFIACLGLLGLSTFTAEQRRKEIGIRKVLGASVKRILALVTKDLVYLVGISFVVAAPISWYFVNEWIENYPYRIEVGWTVFAIGGLVALSLAVLTVSYQSIKAALSNPVDSLKTE